MVGAIVAGAAGAVALQIDATNTTVERRFVRSVDRPVDPAACLSGDVVKGSARASHQGSMWWRDRV